MPKDEIRRLTEKWLEVMTDRWRRWNLHQKTVQAQFGPVYIRMTPMEIEITSWPISEAELQGELSYLAHLENARRFVKNTVESYRLEASKESIALFASELRTDLAKMEFEDEV